MEQRKYVDWQVWSTMVAILILSPTFVSADNFNLGHAPVAPLETQMHKAATIVAPAISPGVANVPLPLAVINVPSAGLIFQAQDGKILARLYQTEGGGGALELVDGNGNATAAFAAHANGPEIQLRDNHQNAAMLLGVTAANSRPLLTLSTSNGMQTQIGESGLAVAGDGGVSSLSSKLLRVAFSPGNAYVELFPGQLTVQRALLANGTRAYPAFFVGDVKSGSAACFHHIGLICNAEAADEP
jgi:hypothetical protein